MTKSNLERQHDAQKCYELASRLGIKTEMYSSDGKLK